MSASSRRSETALRLFVTSALLGAFGAFGTVAAAWAQEAASATEFNIPFGFRLGEENEPIEPSTRDENHNRLIVDGRIMSSASFSRQNTISEFHSSGVGFSGSSATAIGNNLSIVTQGSYNTVIVDSTQINNGNQEAVLNGSLSLD